MTILRGGWRSKNGITDIETFPKQNIFIYFFYFILYCNFFHTFFVNNVLSFTGY